MDLFELSEIDLTSAASAGNYALIKKWVENIWTASRQDADDPHEDVRHLTKSNSLKSPTPVMASVVGKMIRAAALDGEVAIVDLLRSYGESHKILNYCVRGSM